MVKCLILLPKRVSTSFMIPGPLSSCTEFFFLPVCVWLHDIIRNYHEGMSIYSLGHKCCNTITFAPSPPSMLRSHSCLWIGVQNATGRNPFNVEVTFMFMDCNAKSNWQKQHQRKGGILVHSLYVISVLF